MDLCELTFTGESQKMGQCSLESRRQVAGHEPSPTLLKQTHHVKADVTLAERVCAVF